MEGSEDIFKNMSADEIIDLGVELLKDSSVNVDDAINYVKAKDKLERESNPKEKYASN